MPSAVNALAVWIGQAFEGEPEGWNRAMTRDENDEPIMFRRRPNLTKEEEYIAS
jgi:hypothetical protein